MNRVPTKKNPRCTWPPVEPEAARDDHVQSPNRRIREVPLIVRDEALAAYVPHCERDGQRLLRGSTSDGWRRRRRRLGRPRGGRCRRRHVRGRAPAARRSRTKPLAVPDAWMSKSSGSLPSLPSGSSMTTERKRSRSRSASRCTRTPVPQAQPCQLRRIAPAAKVGPVPVRTDQIGRRPRLFSSSAPPPSQFGHARP